MVLVQTTAPKDQLHTYEIFSKLMLADVFEQGREHGQERHGGVVDDLSHTLGLAPGVSKLALLEVFHRLFQIFGRIVQKGPESTFHAVQACLHHGSGKSGGKRLDL